MLVKAPINTMVGDNVIMSNLFHKKETTYLLVANMRTNAAACSVTQSFVYETYCMHMHMQTKDVDIQPYTLH